MKKTPFENVPRLVILCDTSYLMSANAVVPFWRCGKGNAGEDLIYWDTHEDSDNSRFIILPSFEQLNPRSRFDSKESLSDLRRVFLGWANDTTFERELILPTQVKNEISGHFNNTEKDKTARRARILWAEMLIKASEVDLGNIAIPAMQESILGPDSLFDKQLIAYAIERATAGVVVYIATEDGGIMAECAHLFKHKGLNIFTKATRSECKIYHKPIIDEFRKSLSLDEFRNRLPSELYSALIKQLPDI